MCFHNNESGVECKRCINYSKMYDKAKSEGTQAHAEGKSRDSNPYPYKSERWHIWDGAWYVANVLSQPRPPSQYLKRGYR